jgi:hypothetical protein
MDATSSDVASTVRYYIVAGFGTQEHPERHNALDGIIQASGKMDLGPIYARSCMVPSGIYPKDCRACSVTLLGCGSRA